MDILVTGAKGMVGTALVNNLKNIRDNKNRTRPNILVEEIFEYDLNSTQKELEDYCKKADFVFNLAGVNRPENPEDFMKGNFGFASQLLDTLKKYNNKRKKFLFSIKSFAVERLYFFHYLISTDFKIPYYIKLSVFINDLYRYYPDYTPKDFGCNSNQEFFKKLGFDVIFDEKGAMVIR